MEVDGMNLEDMLFEYLDQIMVLISPDTWGNALFNCSKNEMLILLLLYRKSEVNMTQIAEYVKVPLNTATGIVDRMEKKKMILRERSKEDKRVVTIELAEYGKEQIQNIIKEMLYYGRRIIESMTSEEMQLIGKIFSKVTALLQEEHREEADISDKTEKKVKKIMIE